MAKTFAKGIHVRELSESYPMNTNMTGFGWLSKIFASMLVRWTKVALALGGLIDFPSSAIGE